MNGLKISVNADNVTEILGYYHHELSQHTNDINTLKQHVQTLLEESHKNTSSIITPKSNSEQNVSIFIENCNARLEAFAASIKSLSKQMAMLDESSQRLKSYFDSTITSFQLHIEDIGKSIEKVSDSTEVGTYSPRSTKNKKKECKTISSIKKTQQKRKLSSFGKKEKSTSKISILQKGNINEENEGYDYSDDIENENLDEIQKKYELISDQITLIKNSISEIMKNSKNDRDSIRSMINSFSARLENFVTHKDLETAVSSEIEKNKQTIPTPTALVCTNSSRRPIQTPRRKVHVTLINGEALSSDHRQFQTQQIRYSNVTNSNYGNNQSNYFSHSGSNRNLIGANQGGCYTPIQCH